MKSIKQIERRFRLYGAVFLLLEKDNQILLLKRQNTGWHDGEYSLVSGHLDGGMSIIEESIREAKEEAGLTINSADLRVVHIAHQIGIEREYVDFYLKASDWQGEPQNSEPEFCSKIKWFALDKLPLNIVEDVRAALGHISKGGFFSEFDWSKL